MRLRKTKVQGDLTTVAIDTGARNVNRGED